MKNEHSGGPPPSVFSLRCLLQTPCTQTICLSVQISLCIAQSDAASGFPELLHVCCSAVELVRGEGTLSSSHFIYYFRRIYYLAILAGKLMPLACKITPLQAL